MGSITGDLENLGMAGMDDDCSGTRRFYTCVVGRKPSAAKSFVHDTDEMSELIQALATQNTRRNEFARQNLEKNAQTWSYGAASLGVKSRSSMPDLSSMASVAEVLWVDEK